MRYIAQVVDGAGNVAVNGSKGYTNVGDDGELPPPPIESDLAVTVTPEVPASGWVTESPVVEARSSASVLELSIDGGPWQPYTGPIGVTGDGPHTVTFRDSLGGADVVAFDLDGTAPAIVASVDPGVDPSGWWTTPVTVSFTCDDVLSGVVSCPDPVVVDTDGVDQIVTGEVFDVAGNSASAGVEIDLDQAAPRASSLVVEPATVALGGTTLVSADAVDVTSGVAAAEAFVGDDPRVGAGSPLTVTGEVVSGELHRAGGAR